MAGFAALWFARNHFVTLQGFCAWFPVRAYGVLVDPSIFVSSKEGRLFSQGSFSRIPRPLPCKAHKPGTSLSEHFFGCFHLFWRFLEATQLAASPKTTAMQKDPDGAGHGSCPRARLRVAQRSWIKQTDAQAQFHGRDSARNEPLMRAASCAGLGMCLEGRLGVNSGKPKRFWEPLTQTQDSFFHVAVVFDFSPSGFIDKASPSSNRLGEG